MTDIQIDASGTAVISKRRKPPLSETPDRPDLGDDAWFSFEWAIDRAIERTRERGCKQQVRADRNNPHGESLWLVQDVR